ncbi:amidohydrolase [Microbacterium sp. NPDC077663]|uniref:amidohydrolase n=1 Tax=Microbacterium sp. NPDC077663 TaxID=3364189 RepID=UPI0037C89AB6
MTETPKSDARGQEAVYRSVIAAAISEHAAELLALSHAIHARPELKFEEHEAARLVAATLESAGFEVRVGAYGLPTCVEATIGAGPTVTVCAEYDALPEIGHACGHNINAASAVGAALALSRVADSLGIRVQLLGTPAEEGGGGKSLLVDAGAFDDSVLAVMAHAGSEPDYDFTGSTTLGVDNLRVTFEGRAAHAAVAPHTGHNAASAATLAQVAIGLARQQFPDEVRVAAIVQDGGTATNLIPAHAVLDIEVRAYNLEVLESARQRVLACCEAGALAMGCQWRAEDVQPRYEPLLQDDVLSVLWNEEMGALGRPLHPLTDPRRPGSTDMGNVSQRVRAMHPFVGLRGVSASIHTEEFRAAAITAAADDAVLIAASALAGTVARAMSAPDTRAGFVSR